MLEALILKGSSWPYLIVFLFLPIAIFGRYARNKRRARKTDEK